MANSTFLIIQFVFLLFLIETAQKNEEKGDAKYKTNEFSNAAVFYTEGIKVSCKDVALNAVLYKKRAACHFFLGEFRTTLDSQFSYNKWKLGRLVVTALLIERSEFKPWPGTLPCVLGQDTTLTVPLLQVYRWGTSYFDARDNPASVWHLSLHSTETRISSRLTWLAGRQNLAIHHLIFLTCLID